MIRVLVLIAALAATVGCQSGDRVPEGWSALPAINAQQGLVRTVSNPGLGRLDVIICYGPRHSTHTAILLTDSNDQGYFWDPGGYFKTDERKTLLPRDVLLAKPPTLDEYWNFRHRDVKEVQMLVFEWDLTPQEWNTLSQPLTQNAEYKAGGPTPLFDTTTPHGMCGFAVSSYLHDFGSERMRIGTGIFWPHDVGQRLWNKSPDRVIYFRAENGPTTYVREVPAGKLVNRP